MRARLKGWLIAALLLGTAVYAIAEEVTLSTYYPSPRGVYKMLRVGSGNVASPTAQLQVTLPTAETGLALRVDDQDGDTTPFVIDQNGRVGIGTASPSAVSMADIKGTDTTSANYGLGVRNSADVYSLVVRNDGNVGIGTITPTNLLEVVESGSSGKMPNFTRYFTGSAGGALNLEKARGLATAPTAILAGDSLGSIFFRGYDGTIFGNGARIQALATETFSGTARGTDLTLSTVLTGTTSVAERIRLTNAGNVGIGTSTPASPAPGPGGTPLTGNLDVNDVFLRSTGQWVSQGGGAPTISGPFSFLQGATAGWPTPGGFLDLGTHDICLTSGFVANDNSPGFRSWCRVVVPSSSSPNDWVIETQNATCFAYCLDW